MKFLLDQIEKAILTYSEVELMTAFLVIEPGRHRFRRLPSE